MKTGERGPLCCPPGPLYNKGLPSASAGHVRGLIPGSQVEQKKSPPLSPPEGRLSLSPYQNPSSIREASRSTAPQEVQQDPPALPSLFHYFVQT